MSDDTGHWVLLCRAGTRLCALPLEHVIETFRPLPVEPLGGPRFVRGLSIIRGRPIPVVDAPGLLGTAKVAPRRFVTVRAGARIVALALDDVIGVRRVSTASLRALPPLLQDADSDAISAIGILDAELLVLLQSARLMLEDDSSRDGAGGDA